MQSCAVTGVKSKTELKRAKQNFKAQGFKVYANGG